MIPKSVLNLERIHDLQDKFKGNPNWKTQSSTLNHKTVTLGTEQNPQLINIGLACSPKEERPLVNLCKEYKDVFTWTYDNLKTFDSSIMQHNTPLKPYARPYQQKLRKMHPRLEPSIKKELEKLLKDIIIFLIRHTQWILDLVHARKKRWDIILCVDFRNLNRASEKNNYPVLSMEQILQTILGA